MQAILAVEFSVWRTRTGQCIIDATEVAMDDQFKLARFIEAQAPFYESAVAELRAGQKCTHWMWFIFPQIAGLGQSDDSVKFAIGSLAEARAYLADPLLGARLRECVALVTAVQGRTAHQIFGFPDDLKLHSSLTLFAIAAPGEALFQACLNKYYDGVHSPDTIALLAKKDAA